MTAPVTLFVFNRPSTTQQVFDQIRAYQPSRLFVVADGPRSAADVPLCQKTRSIVEQVDWECVVQTNYSEVNLGCNGRVISGLTWVFDHCEESIVLEDDCVPDPSFFLYCAALLEMYRHDQRVMAINGSNYQFGRRRSSYSYYFTRYAHIWGWASWRRAWQCFTDGASDWPALRDTSWLRDILGDADAAAYFRIAFDSMMAGDRTWDFKWNFSCWVQNGLAVAPSTNLVSNIGFGTDATNTTALTRRAGLPTVALQFPLQHPHTMVRNGEADRFDFKQSFPSDAYHQVRRRLGAAMPSTMRAQLYSMMARLRLEGRH